MFASQSLACAALMCGAAAAATLAGCSTVSPSQYVSPRVTGQVLELETRQPIAGVQVRRADSEGRVASDSNSARGHYATDSAAARTGRDGRFTIPAVKILGPLGGPGWYSVTLAFERGGYESVVKSYTLKDATNRPSGEPWVDAGEILLPKTGLRHTE